MNNRLKFLVTLAFAVTLPGSLLAQATGGITGTVALLSTRDGIREVAVTLCPDSGRQVLTTIEGASMLPPRDRMGGIRISTSDGQGVAASRITFSELSADCTDARQTTTDAMGRFAFSEVRAGSYRVHVQRPGYIGPLPARGLPPQVLTQSVTLTAEKSTQDLTFSLLKGGAIGGTVRDVNGKTIASASVQVLPANAAANQIPLTTGPTDDRGQYRLFWLPPGDFNVIVRVGSVASIATLSNGQSALISADSSQSAGSPSYAPTYYRSGASSADADTITLREGEDVSSIDVLMRPLPVAAR